MFGFGGLSELMFIFFLAMLIFGPEKLPEIGRMLAKGMAEVRKASNELKRTLNAELAISEQEIEARRRAAAPPPIGLAPPAPVVPMAAMAPLAPLAPMAPISPEPMAAPIAPEPTASEPPETWASEASFAPPAADPTPVETARQTSWNSWTETTPTAEPASAEAAGAGADADAAAPEPTGDRSDIVPEPFDDRSEIVPEPR